MASPNVDPAAGADPGAGTGGEPGIIAPDHGTSDPAAGSSAATPEPGTDEFTRTVAAGGEKAVGIAQHWQRVASERDRELQGVTEHLGDLMTQHGGAEGLRNAIANASAVLTRIDGDPNLRAAVYQQGTAADTATSDTGDEYEDPIETIKRLKVENADFRSRLGTVEMAGTQNKFEKLIDNFFDEEIEPGVPLRAVVEDSEKAQMVRGGLEALQVYQGTEQGRAALAGLDASGVKKIMQTRLSLTDMARIVSRAQRRKLELETGAGTAPAPGGTTGMDTAPAGGSPVQALESWARNEGIDLSHFQVGR